VPEGLKSPVVLDDPEPDALVPAEGHVERVQAGEGFNVQLVPREVRKLPVGGAVKVTEEAPEVREVAAVDLGIGAR